LQNKMKKISKKSDVVVNSLLEYLDESQEAYLLPEVTKELEALTKGADDAAKISVVSCVPLGKQQQEKLQRLIEKLLVKKLPVENKIDKSILGGFTLQIGDWFLDASIYRDLFALKDSMLS